MLTRLTVAALIWSASVPARASTTAPPLTDHRVRACRDLLTTDDRGSVRRPVLADHSILLGHVAHGGRHTVYLFRSSHGEGFLDLARMGVRTIISDRRVEVLTLTDDQYGQLTDPTAMLGEIEVHFPQVHRDHVMTAVTRRYDPRR